MRAIALLCALVVLGGIVTVFPTTRAAAAARPSPAPSSVVAQIGRYQQIARRWQHAIGKPATPSSFSARRSPDPAYRAWVLRLWKARADRAQQQASGRLAARVREYQASVAHWQRVIGLPGGPLRQTAAVSPSLAERQALVVHWRRRAQQLERRAKHPPYESAWRCIHNYEGSWSDSGGPYYGGLQMDISFQRHYGGYLLQTKGTAEHWTPTEQMWVAVRALRSGRGFYPWPNTARACGLI